MTSKRARGKVYARIYRAFRKHGYKGVLPSGVVKRWARWALDVRPDCYKPDVGLPEPEGPYILGLVDDDDAEAYFRAVDAVTEPAFVSDGFDDMIYLGPVWPDGFWLTP